MVQKSLKFLLISGVFILSTILSSDFSQAREVEVLKQGLEKTFNSKNKNELFNLFSEEIAKDISQRFDAFIKVFPNASWNIKFLKDLKQP